MNNISKSEFSLIIDSKQMLDNKLFQMISSEGFKRTDWNKVPNDFLKYLFLHDEPVMGKKRTEKTKKEYLRELDCLFSFFNQPLQEITPEDALAFQYWIDRQEYAATTMRRKSTVVKQFLQYLYKIGVLSADVTYKMKKISQPKEQLVDRDLYESDVNDLLDHFKRTNWFAFTLLFVLASTGLRIEELATAKWSGLFYYPKLGLHFLNVIGKGNKPRTAIIFNDVLDSIIEFRKRRGLKVEIDPGDTTAFFPKPIGSHYSSKYLSNEFSNLVEATNFNFIKHRTDRITPHTCRHYTAAYLSDKGADIRAIQDALGHSSIITTEGYLWKKRKLENHAGLKLGKNFVV